MPLLRASARRPWQSNWTMPCRYKYVIDDNWRVDWSQPYRQDGPNFCNNLFEVSSNTPPQAYVPEAKLGAIRKEFISMALRVKLSLGPKLLGR